MLEKGRVIESGTHEDLLQRGEAYSRLYQAQFGPMTTTVIRIVRAELEHRLAGIWYGNEPPPAWLKGLVPLYRLASPDRQAVEIKKEMRRPEWDLHRGCRKHHRRR